MKYFLIFADCYPAPARHGIRKLRDRIILREFDEIHSIHFIEFTLWMTMSGVRDRDRRKRNRRQTEWNTGLVRIFLRCEGGKPVKVNPLGCRGLEWVQVKLKFFHILTSAICAGTIALCSSMVSQKDI